MRTMPPGWMVALKAGQKPICLYVLTCTSGRVYRFTSNPGRDYIISGQIYNHMLLVSRSAISFQTGIKSDTFDITLSLATGIITRADILAGLFRGATLTLDLALSDRPDLGTVPLMMADMGECSALGRMEASFSAHSLTSRLEIKMARQTSATCEYRLGDSNCKANIAAFLVSTTITSVVGAYEFRVNHALGGTTSAQYGYGTMLFQSGMNAGFAFDIKSVVHGSPSDVSLWLPAGYLAVPGDKVLISPGCNKILVNVAIGTDPTTGKPVYTTTQGDCAVVYNNGINNSSQPFTPGTDRINSGGQ